MKFWTIQTKDVVEHIQEKGIFQPDFNFSRYLQKNENLSELYSLILQSFNNINQTNLPGVIFAFVRSDNTSLYPIGSMEEFEEFIKIKRDVIYSFWKNLENSVILELEYEDFSFNPIFIDINDFQYLMPPFVPLLFPYTAESGARIKSDISQGRISRSEFPSYLIQAHLPYIKKNNVINTYPVFDLDA